MNLLRDDEGGLLDRSEIIGSAVALAIAGLGAYALLLAVPVYGGKMCGPRALAGNPGADSHSRRRRKAAVLGK